MHGDDKEGNARAVSKAVEQRDERKRSSREIFLHVGALYRSVRMRRAPCVCIEGFREAAPRPGVGGLWAAHALSCGSSRDLSPQREGLFRTKSTNGESERERESARKSEGCVIRRRLCLGGHAACFCCMGERTARHPSMLYTYFVFHRRKRRAGTGERVRGGGADCAFGGTGSCLRNHIKRDHKRRPSPSALWPFHPLLRSK